MLFQSEREIMDKLGKFMFGLIKVFNQSLKNQKGIKLSMNQARILNIIRQSTGITAGQVAEIVQITPAGMASNIHFLEENEFIKKIQSKTDKREFYLELTRKGQAKVRSIFIFMWL